LCWRRLRRCPSPDHRSRTSAFRPSWAPRTTAGPPFYPISRQGSPPSPRHCSPAPPPAGYVPTRNQPPDQPQQPSTPCGRKG
jgi:hypothetical protein